MLRRYLLYSLLLGVMVVIGVMLRQQSLLAEVASVGASDEGQTTGVKFSHKLHSKDLGIECSMCHGAAATSKLASDNLLAGHDNCMTCHEEQLSNSCDFCHSDPANIVPRELPEREIVFSHEKHLAMKDVECTTCHVGVNDTESMDAVVTPAMATCTTCHNARTASNTCESCHTNFVTLIPPDHRFSDFRRSHRDIARLGGLDASCQTCHTETFCQQCHQSTGLKAFGKGDLSTEPRPRNWARDSKDELILQSIHDLNYRFTHGIDAKGRQADCASCHDAETFCAQCHQAGGNITQSSFKPASHAMPGFTTLGRGSGGGLHAEEARRDIESCISCHDVEGRDPTCMTCHTESGSVR